LVQCKKDLTKKSEQNIAQAQMISEKNNEVEDIKEKFDEFKENCVEGGENFYYSSAKTITHSWKNPRGKSVQLPVQDFLQHITDYAELARRNKLYLFNGVDDPDYDTKVVKAYKLVNKNYRSDELNFGENERWLTSLEAKLMEDTGVDCEDLSHKTMALWKEMGVAVGDANCYIGEVFSSSNLGHATLGIRDSTGVERHLNSSNSFEKFTNLKDYPVFGINDPSFKTNWFNLKIVDYGYNWVYAFNNMDKPEVLEDFIVRNSNSKPDETQFNTYTELRNVVNVANTSGLEKVKNCTVEIEGREWQGNNAGVVYIKIPATLIGREVEIKYSKEGFKTRTYKRTFVKESTTSFVVTLYRGTN